MRSKKPSLSHLLALVLLLFQSLTWANASTADADLFPASPVEYRAMDAGVSGDPFKLCVPCRCCARADPNDCSTMPCCFGIDCNLPDKPFGVCAFVPKTCNCTSCP